MKVLFFDIDGTLLDTFHGIYDVPSTVKQEIQRLQSLGYKCIIATGRPYASINQKVLDCHFDGYVLCNGAHVEINNTIIYEHIMDIDKVKELLEFLENYTIEYIIEGKRYCYLKPEYKVIEDFFRMFKVNFNYIKRNYIKEEAIKDCLKLEVMTTHEQYEELLQFSSERFGFDAHGTGNMMEIYDDTVTKAEGVTKILEYLNVDIKDSYAFGDGLNDIEMIKAVGHGIAMGNAKDEVKKAADEVIGTLLEDGLAKYLKTIK